MAIAWIYYSRKCNNALSAIEVNKPTAIVNMAGKAQTAQKSPILTSHLSGKDGSRNKCRVTSGVLVDRVFGGPRNQDLTLKEATDGRCDFSTVRSGRGNADAKCLSDSLGKG